MPGRILFLGLLFIAGGVAAIADILYALKERRISINVGVFMLPVGIGLLRGKLSSQWWARFWMILGYLLCAAAVILSVAFPRFLTLTWHDTVVLRGREVIPYMTAAAVIVALLIRLLHRLLDSEIACLYFNGKARKPGGRTTAKSRVRTESKSQKGARKKTTRPKPRRDA